jgi:phage-related protein
MARFPTATEKPLHWVGSSKKDLLAFPGEVVDDFGYALSVVQHGGTPPSAKAWKGEGPGVFELIEEHRGDAFRAVYTVRFERARKRCHTKICVTKRIRWITQRNESAVQVTCRKLNALQARGLHLL